MLKIKSKNGCAKLVCWQKITLNGRRPAKKPHESQQHRLQLPLRQHEPRLQGLQALLARDEVRLQGLQALLARDEALLHSL